MILIIQKHYCINLQRDWVKWKLTATATITENRSTTKHTGIQRNMWDVGEKDCYHLSKTICHKSYLSLMNLKFLSSELEKWALLPHDYDDSEERYPVMYLQDAQICSMGMPNTAVGN
jgi:hypothetical protein